MRTKKLFAVALVAAMTMGLVACGQDVTANNNSSSSTSSAPAASEAAPAASEAAPAADAAAASDPTVTMILGNFCAEGEPGQNASLLFAEKAAEYSGGSVTVEVHNASELGNAPEMAEQTSLGAIEACMVCEATLDKYDPRYALLPMPYGYSSYKQAYAVDDGPFREWVQDGKLEESNLHAVNAWDYGFRNLTNSARPVQHPADVKGLKIRTPQEIQLTACMEALGADVQQIVFSELISALKQKVVDGQENPISTIYNNSLWECEQHYLTMTRHQWEAMNLVVNNDWWTGLTDAQREAIEKAAADAQKSMREEVSSSENDYIDKLEAEGMEVIREIDTKEFQDAMGPAYKQLADYVGDASLVDKMNEIIASVQP